VLGRVLQYVRVTATNHMVFFIRKMPHQQELNLTDGGLDVIGIRALQAKRMQVIKAADKVAVLIIEFFVIDRKMIVPSQ